MNTLLFIVALAAGMAAGGASMLLLSFVYDAVVNHRGSSAKVWGILLLISIGGYLMCSLINGKVFIISLISLAIAVYIKRDDVFSRTWG